MPRIAGRQVAESFIQLFFFFFVALAILCYVIVGTAYYILLSFYCWPAIFIPNDGVNIIPRSVFILLANTDYEES